jgi:hypothetical protein
MCFVQALQPQCGGGIFQNIECGTSTAEKLGFVNFRHRFNAVGLGRRRRSLLKPITAKEEHESFIVDDGNRIPKYRGISVNKRNCVKNEPDSSFIDHSSAFSGTLFIQLYCFLLSFIESTSSIPIKCVMNKEYSYAFTIDVFKILFLSTS